MDDRKLIAAIITAGMLPILPIPESRTPSGAVTDEEGDGLLRAVGHAVGLYRSVLEGVWGGPIQGTARI
jgi:hypothetical protein